jgi:hypothetical protein
MLRSIGSIHFQRMLCALHAGLKYDRGGALMGELIQLFPVSKTEQSCMNCENGYIGSGGLFCIEFKEMIYDDSIAVECDTYENG